MPRVKQPIGDKTAWILGIVGIALIVAIYSWLSYRQHRANPSDTTIPNLFQLIDGFRQVATPVANPFKDEDLNWWDAVRSTRIYQDLTASYWRFFTGMTAGCLLSVILGVLMGCYPVLESFLLPPLAFLAKVPGTAMLAVFFVVAGTGEFMFFAMIAFGVLPTLAVAIYLSAKHDLHEEEIFKAYTLGASSDEVICNIVLPQIMPKILESIRLQIGPAMVYLIAAEMLVGQVGIGYQIRMQQRLLNMNIVYDYILILGVFGLLMDRGMLLARRVICPWYSRWR